MSNYFIFRYRRSVRRVRRLTRTLSKDSRAYVDQHIWGKWHQLKVVRRFFIVWWIVLGISLIGLVHQLGLLGRANQVIFGVSGGTFTQGAVGSVKVLNPVLPESSTSSDINSLIFSGLTRYDDHRQLAPDLATSWTVSPDGRTYTFKLRHGVKWQDDVPFTSTDVAFTVAAIQDPDSRSPLASSWQGVTVATPDDYTVAFTLPAPLDSFLDSTTLGIVPRHLLEQVEPSQLREADFNRHPIGTGPFELKTFAPSANVIELAASPKYYLGKPRLDNFNFRFYGSTADALTAYAQHQVTSPGQITSDQLAQANKLDHLRQIQFSLPEETTLFFNTTSPGLNDATLRGIISHSIDRRRLVDTAVGGEGLAVTQPLLPGQVGYSAKYAGSPVSAAAAQSALNASGWTLKDGVRQKGGQSLSFTLVTATDPQFQAVANNVADQLRPLGIKVAVKAVALDELQQTYMRPRNFQLLLFGVNLGADPDVYAFWHSSQAKDPGVNLSQYNSSAADAALESARIKTDPALRSAKYDAFLKAWNADNPAVVLYQPSYDYGVLDTVLGVSGHPIVAASDRYDGVEKWTVRQRFALPH